MRDFLAVRPLLVPLLFGVAWFAIVWTSGEHGFWLPLGVYSGVISLAGLWIYRRWMERLWAADWGDLLNGLGVGAVLVGASWLLYPPLAEAVPAVADETRRLYRIVREAPGPGVAAPLGVVIVVGEEILWRGIFLEAMRLRTGPVAAVLWSAVAYAVSVAGHASFVLCGLALVWGVVWGAQRVARDGLVAPLVAHLVWLWAILVAFPLN